MRWAIDAVQLTSYIKSLPEGLDTKIYPEGHQISSSNAQKIILARSIVNKPKILFLENPTDKMDEDCTNDIIDFITSKNNPWTVIVSSKNDYWKQKCTRKIIMKKGSISHDSNN